MRPKLRGSDAARRSFETLARVGGTLSSALFVAQDMGKQKAREKSNLMATLKMETPEEAAGKMPGDPLFRGPKEYLDG